LDAPQILMAEKSSSSGKEGDGGRQLFEEDEEDQDPQDTTDNDEEDTMALLTEQLIGIQQRYVSTFAAVERRVY
jgi:hypothetical protein